MIYFQGRQCAVLCPGDSPFTFGRGADRTLRFGHNVVHGGEDQHISRNVGSIRWDDGRWVVCNDSEKRPFDIILRGVSNPVPPRSAPDSRSLWAVSPPGLDIQVVAPSGRYLLSVRVDGPRPQLAEPPGGGLDTVPLPYPTDRERLLLAAKFLALPNPGEAIGNREAAEYATTAARARGEPDVTEFAVGDCVGRWCRKLQELGVIGISGRNNINELGRQLLAWGILRQEDGGLLRPGA